MSLESIQEKAVLTYSKNMEFFKEHQQNLYKKLQVFELALELEEREENFILEYKEDGYFDIYNKTEKQWLYEKNSLDYSKDIVYHITMDAKKNSFRTFYRFEYEEDIVEQSKTASILSHTIFGNAPIVQYVNDALPKNEIIKQAYLYLIFGLGLGFHIPLIHEKVKSKVYLLVEPSLEVFRLSLFTTDYIQLSQESLVHFAVAETEENFQRLFSSLHQKTHFYNHYIKFFLFSNSCDIYIQAIRK